MIGVKIKPLSVNKAWKGRRYKTDAYKCFEKNLYFSLPMLDIPKDKKLRLALEFGFSSMSSDLSNPLKMVEDILSKRYNFNDNKVYEISMKKKIVKKGAEYMMFDIEVIEDKLQR